MADTIQIVSWSLDHECRFRPGGTLDARTRESLGALNYCSQVMRGPRRQKDVFGDIVVQGYFDGLALDGTLRGGPRIPHTGYIVSKLLHGFGDKGELFRICEHCPANAAPGRMAGCDSYLVPWKLPREMDAQFNEVVEKLGLVSEWSECFVTTLPLWFGLWIESPLSPRAVSLLHAVFGELLGIDRPGWGITLEHRGKFAQFVSALEIVQRHGIAMRVSLSPPGHTDFGIRTTFPHCPSCKAMANVERWKTPYPRTPQACRVCGATFSPAATARSRWESHEDDPDLRELLGAADYRALLHSCFIAQGFPARNVPALIAANEAKEKREEERLRYHRERAEKHAQILQARVFAGIPTVEPPPSEFENPEDGPPVNDRYYTAENLDALIQRATTLGARTLFMTHWSASDDLQRKAHEERPRKGLDPAAKLREWIAEGCREKFSIHFVLPDTLLD